MSINQEKLEIINIEGNVLVTANPGTGKTRLLAYKYLDLLKKGIKPEKILCLTFTEKAKLEMEEKIIEVLTDEKFDFNFSDLRIFTFHSFAMSNLDEEEVISTNLLRYTIYKYIKEKDIFNYNNDKLIEDIVPKIEALMRYLKNFGILPEHIDKEEVKKHIQEYKKYTKEQLDSFLEYFVDIFYFYETSKKKKGIDYTDMLIKFLELKKIDQYDYVLVDELQDVNLLEAEIALKSGKNFFAVGDKKQAIFGFQGGSILNFKKFENSTKKVLSENFRSCQDILDYAKEFFIKRTNEKSHLQELENLKNVNNKKGSKVKIYEVDKSKKYAAACELAKSLEGQTAIIARTNNQILKINKELLARNIEFTTTFNQGSKDAKTYIIDFLKGILTNDLQLIKNSMITPFFPSSIQQAFELSNEKDINEIYNKVNAFKELKENTKNIEDVNRLFFNIIFPVSVAYGKDYLNAAIKIYDSFNEAINVLENKDFDSIFDYLEATDLSSDELENEKGIIVTTVHKAKGREFTNVIYLPSETGDQDNFIDYIVECILKSKGFFAKEELEEESLRIDFVAFTRAMNNLIIVSEESEKYLNELSELKTIETETIENFDFNMNLKKAYNLFVNKKYDEAINLLNNKKNWIRDFVENHFKNLKSISFTSLTKNPYHYFVEEILNIREKSQSMDFGSEIHIYAKKILNNEPFFCDEKIKPFVENTKILIEKIKEKYPSIENVEYPFSYPLKDLGINCNLQFNGRIDAIFRNEDEYLIVDWKSSKSYDNNSEYRRQLEAYKKVYSLKEKIPYEKIKVALGYVGLRTAINTGKIDYYLDDRQPQKTAFETLSKKINIILSWINNVDLFFEDFIKTKEDNFLWMSIVETYKNEQKKI